MSTAAHLFWRCVMVALLFGCVGAAAQSGRLAAPPLPPPAPIRFGILPVGGAVESRENWAPVLADLGRALGRPVSMLSVTSYESLDQAIQRNEVDLALLSGKLALDAVVARRADVLAQMMPSEDGGTHCAVLLARKTGPLRALDDLLAQPGRWRLARGESRSVSGFMVPQLELFLPRRIDMETRFLSDTVDTHQGNALAVANGDADVATNNSTDFERFKAQFPVEAERLQIIWRSEPIPVAQIVLRRGYPPAFQQRLQDFIVNYGRVPGPRGDAEREVLKSLRAGPGYIAADNTALLPAALLDYRLAKERALNARWVSDAARQARLQRIESLYAQQTAVLREGAPPSRPVP